MSKIFIRRRRADGETRKVPFDDGVFILLLDPAMDNGVLSSQLKFPYFARAIDPASLVKLLGSKVFSPVVFQLAEPKFQRLRSIDALRTVRLHRAKSEN